MLLLPPAVPSPSSANAPSPIASPSLTGANCPAAATDFLSLVAFLQPLDLPLAVVTLCIGACSGDADMLRVTLDDILRSELKVKGKKRIEKVGFACEKNKSKPAYKIKNTDGREKKRNAKGGNEGGIYRSALSLACFC